MSEESLATFLKYDTAFEDITGPSPSIELLCEASLALFHEACVYDQASKSIFVTSNQLQNDVGADYIHTSNKHIKLLRIFDGGHNKRAKFYEITFPRSAYAMLNGGVNYDQKSILFCAQGSRNSVDVGGIIAVQIPDAEETTTPEPQVLVSDFHGLSFNSVNDVVVHPEDGSIWFTDPCYGYHQGIRNKPVLPNQVYRYDVKTSSIRAVADGFTRPNGLCFSPDLKTLYVTDTGSIHGSSDVPIDLAGPSHIYAFDICFVRGAPFLTNRRLFAYAAGRFPDGIKCDTQGNVYSGCGDGIEVWNAQGVLLGVIGIKGGVANFCFGENGELYACNETRFWKIRLNRELVRGALLGI